MIPLFKYYPLLKDKLPHVALGEFPTPVERLERLGEDIGADRLYIKRDDLSGKVYGGNKIRKLEFILGQALRSGVKEVLAFGFAGSNHALATAIYAEKVGLKSISMLLPQDNAHYVRRNLLMSHYCGAKLHQNRNIPFIAGGTAYQLMRHKLRNGQFPQIIPPGGSSPSGTIGYVNAAFELKEQVVAGEMPEPDRIYVALGSMGTAVGLILGLKAADLKSRVISVRVVDKKYADERKLIKLFHKVNSFLHYLDLSFKRFELSEKDIEIRHGFFGQRYALFTEEGMEAVERMEENEGIKLEGTYTGKTLAGLINDVKKQDLRDKTILFWNTYNSRDFSEKIADIDYHQLPQCFHRYFEEEVQPRDRH
ncbi:MAG: pyridoxal-phosphate dependent enzyme [Deltaproteobacteria bacterium]|nr:MAG: pyridoxal-phosphate dependent enzyme [Deltaproteobacteria bacterium]